MKFKFLPLWFLLAITISACSLTTGSPPRSTGEAGGSSLRPVESPAIIDLDMFNELDGWAVTEAEIVRTSDGGLTWYDVTPPGMDETGYSVDALFLDTGHAWIQKPDYDQFPDSGTLYRSLDGGRTWSEFTVPFSRGDLNFVDEENGWVLADLGVGAGSNAVAVYRTSSGGANWERVYTNDPNEPEVGSSLPLGGIKSDLVSLDGDTAWVTGVVYSPGEIYLYRTEDGGSSWKLVSLELPPGAEQSELGINSDQLKFVTGRHGYLAVHMAGESLQTAVYVTHDSGDTWSLTPQLVDGAGASAFLTEQDAILYTGEEFQVTGDGAQSWSIVRPDVLFGESFMDMEFVNPLSGWTITMDPSTNYRSVYRTQDGGATWHPIVP